MEFSGSPTAAAPAEGDPSSDPSPSGAKQPPLPEVINICETGDLILDTTFENSKATLRAARRSLPRAPATATPSRGGSEPLPAPAPPRARVRLAFRVDHGVLRRQSKYFDRLLGDARFREARDIAAAFAALSARGVEPKSAAAGPADLPWVAVHDDDEATRYAGRDVAFADLLRVLHGRGAEAEAEAAAARGAVAMPYVTTLAVLADRFDCAAAVSKYVSTGLKFKWPVTSRRPVGGAGGGGGSGRDEALGPVMTRSNENILRQKILVSWLLNQPGKFQAATRELIMSGSCRWSSFGEEEGADESEDATWWYLQDGLEQELQYRRHCILNTIASVQQHFLALYTARGPGARQCKLGYDSSAACDSYQLGEMVRFLAHKRLLSLVDFSPASLDAVPDAGLLPVDSLLAALRQCPAYQIDKNHSNCGLRTRLLPILDFIQALLSAGSVPLARAAWKSDRQAAAWMPPLPEGSADKNRSAGTKDDGDDRPFRFTRSMAGDQRLRYENAMGADKFARDVLTATSWDWTAEDQGPDHISTTPKWSWR